MQLNKNAFSNDNIVFNVLMINFLGHKNKAIIHTHTHTYTDK